MEPALPVEQPSHSQQLDWHSAPEAALRCPSVPQRMVPPLATRRRTRSWWLTRCAHSVARRQLTLRWHASCRQWSDVTCEWQNSTSASENVDCTPPNWAVHDTALRTVISRDIFIKLTPVTRLHACVRSRVRLVGAHIFARRSPASTTSRIAQPNFESHLSQSSR